MTGAFRALPPITPDTRARCKTPAAGFAPPPAVGYDRGMTEPERRERNARCCIVGGGPAGMMLGLLLARAGIETVVVEKHADFLRDFRGDTVHPSTLAIMDELGVLERFLARPHHEVDRLTARFGTRVYTIADFRRLRGAACPFIAFMPQWEFLDFLADEAEPLPAFTLLRSTEAVDLLRDGPRVTGVRARDKDGTLDITAGLTVGCDGRRSIVREKAGLAVDSVGAPMDVLWFRVDRRDSATPPEFLQVGSGHVLICIDRGDYFQCALVIAKGGLDAQRARGIAGFRALVTGIAPELAPAIGDVRDWDDVKLLTVAVDRLERWSLPGLLCIGDAAHAMSPIGGVGINLAIQDAVATANLLAPILAARAPTADELDAVRTRRLFPARVVQAVQVQVQARLISAFLAGRTEAPLAMRLAGSMPVLQRALARAIGLGIRQEHVASPAVGDVR